MQLIQYTRITNSLRQPLTQMAKVSPKAMP
jgi:hypothetical protein